MKKIVVAFSGPSNSGKTTLVVKLSQILIEKSYKVCIVKHDPKDKAQFDQEGKDSYKFSSTGADVAVVSPKKTTIFKKSTSSIDELIEVFKDFDYLFVEGLKDLDIPRITIFRDKLEEEYFKYSNAIAVDETINSDEIPSSCDYLDLNDTQQIIEWIERNGRKV